MRRTIDGFHQDQHGDWVAQLDCLHSQHVRHAPPVWPRPWVLTEEGRSGRIGSALDCPLCDRAEMPPGLHLARTAGPFDADRLPPALQSDHVVANRTWGLLRVIEGSVRFTLATEPAVDTELVAGDEQPIPPGVPHSLTLTGPTVVAVDFFVKETDQPS